MTSAVGAVRQTQVAAESAKRAGIQGLRAVAVALVVSEHAFGFPRGGFTGVDVFFVISGYLISRILLGGLESARTVGLMRFYARRVRRIVPVAAVVAAATIAVAYLLWYRPRADQTLLDGLASVFWVANWHFAAMGTDYLAGSADPSPFQHYWSLSVEEQFYVFWPLCLVALTALGARLRRRPAVLAGGLAGIAAVGFAWATVLTALDAPLAYFDLVSRTWEFAVGALAAVLGDAGWVPATIRRWAPICGLGLILVGALLLTDHTPFPGPWAAVPVAGAAFVLLGTDASRGAFLITNAPMRYLGDISYSLYLWHFPVLVFAASLTGRPGWFSGLIALPLAAVLSIASYRWVEDPLRSSRWLRAWESPSANLRRHSMALGAALIAVVMGLAAFQFHPSRSFVMASRTVPAERAAATVSFQSGQEVSAAIRGASHPSAGVEPIPSFDELTPAQLSEEMERCSNDVSARPLRACESGRGPLRVAIMGDSVALSWAPLLERAFPEGTSFLGVGVASCSPWDLAHGARFSREGFVRDCAQARQLQFERIRAWSPDVVVVSSAAGAFSLQQGDETGVAGWAAGVARTVATLKTSARRVVVLGSPPVGEDPRACLNKVTGADGCRSSLRQVDVDKVTAERAGSTAAGGEYIDVTSWFCGADGKCPLTIGPYAVRVDSTHITAAMAQSLAPLLVAALERSSGSQ
ncbi:acyltransferase family protein [Sinomonas sp. JGH33]|uniref:Acyltransferase family protein n=1 Tax=Sinomonas terricola TaxID=3110330 RepID=A0ABU5T1J0_9MICC|nr:acyltransferase family protein [Sinomonas sp. JGH33]MEA5453402.1 acyltransferase family protein [Sinomonas sp. JGH33]